MPKIFISYRRDDSAYPAQVIHETLVAKFGEEAVFFDVDSIPVGMDFHGILNEAVAKCDVLLAVIGDHWLNAKDGAGNRRLDDPNDFVRIEIEAALSRDIPVVPVLVGKAMVPRAEQMPDSLRKLARRNAAEVRPGKDFRSHLERLAKGIENVAEIAERAAKHRESSVQPKPSSKTPSEPLTTEQPQQQIRHPNSSKKQGKQTSLETITNSIGLKLRLIPSGEFMMGSADSDKQADDSEKPQHRVEITSPFYLSVYPLTQAEYEKVMGDNPSWFEGDENRPVEVVNWFRAVEFCNKLSKLEELPLYYDLGEKVVSIVGGTGYRLPTEAEWEYACRAGTSTRWSFGDDESKLGEYVWHDRNSRDSTHPVGEKKPNAWGLYDMHGNEFEWCWDWYGEDYYKNSPTTDPSGPTSGDERVLRGGSYKNVAWYLRSANRSHGQPDDRIFNHGGFRVARTYD